MSQKYASRHTGITSRTIKCFQKQMHSNTILHFYFYLFKELTAVCDILQCGKGLGLILSSLHINNDIQNECTEKELQG